MKVGEAESKMAKMSTCINYVENAVKNKEVVTMGDDKSSVSSSVAKLVEFCKEYRELLAIAVNNAEVKLGGE